MVQCIHLHFPFSQSFLGVDQEIKYVTQSGMEFPNLIKFEEMLATKSELASQLHIEWKPVKFDLNQEILDEEERKLYQSLKNKNLDRFYQNLVRGKSVYIECLDQLKQAFSNTSENSYIKEGLKLNFNTIEDFELFSKHFQVV